MSEIIKTTDNLSNSLFDKIAGIIQNARSNVQTAVNAELVLLNWNIGRIIKEEILDNQRAEYGKQVISELSRQLTMQYGRGYGQRNLFNMVNFYEAFPDLNILQSLTAKLSWTHILEIMNIKDSLKREFYITMCINEGWSVRSLKDRISSMLYERTVISKKPEQTIINDLELLKNENKMSADLFFRDPYVLDFLGLKDTYSEKDLENAILAELEKFILEMGIDFAFLARQKRIIIDNEDHYIDLLFYHRKMRRLVVVELKLDKFKAEYKGQVELYLRWLEKNEMIPGENSPVGLILCAEKTSETVELLELDKSGMHVAQYLTELPPKEIFEKKLHEAVSKAKLLLEQRKEN